MERQDAYELFHAGIAEQNQYLLQRQQEFRLAADAVDRDLESTRRSGGRGAVLLEPAVATTRKAGAAVPRLPAGFHRS